MFNQRQLLQIVNADGHRHGDEKTKSIAQILKCIQNIIILTDTEAVAVLV